MQRAPRRFALLVGAATLIGGCSLLAPPTPALSPSQAAATQTPTPAASAPPSPTRSPTPSTAPPASPEPSSGPVAGGGWHAVVQALDAPAAWLDFGFAKNGDVIAIGTDDATQQPLRLFVDRFSPAGRKRSAHHLGRSVTPIAGDWAAIDPVDDTVVIDDFNSSTGLFTLRRFWTGTGANISNAPTDWGISRLALDARGRQYGLPQYGVDGNAYAAVVRLDRRSRLQAGVDYWLRPLTATSRPRLPGVLAFPVAIAVGLDGRVLVVDEPDIAATYPDGRPRELAVVTSLGSNLGGPRQWELPGEWPFGSQGFGTWSHRLAIAGAADGSVYVGEPVLDATGQAITGGRVRHLSSSGELLDTWGGGELDQGVFAPSHPAVDAQGRLWVIDIDLAGRSTIAVLEPA
jgi:hypothetical protein